MYVLGIHDSHNSTACLLKDGKIEACVSEERFKRIKNYTGIPLNSINYVLNFCKIKPEDLDLIVLSNRILALPTEVEINKTKSTFHHLLRILKKGMLILPEKFYFKLYNKLVPIYYGTKKRKKTYSKLLGIDENKIVFVDHHLCHAYTAFYGSGFKDNFLVFTLDGGGDGLCGTVNIVENGEIKKISETSYLHSLGILYLEITRFLGMKPLEHEYKVMGLAPYASPEGVERSYKILKKVITLKENSLQFYSPVKTPNFKKYVRENLYLHRFDWIAGAIQKLTEELVVEWIRRAIEKTGIHDVALAGGVFMNVKLNLKIMNMPEVRKLFVFPSCGDESLAIGSAYYGYEQLCKDEGRKVDIQPLGDLYLGPNYSNEYIEKILRKEKGIKYKFFENIEEKIAELLVNNQVVARFSGRMEWGARALGNRSILANASDYGVVKIINEMIKQRDFWMPFAPTIIKEFEEEYLINPKKIPAPYMILAFNSKERAKKDLVAAMHPYDYTIRPQVLNKETNEKYYKIIKIFEECTGMGGILNTSFNLHGYPIVCSPEDALYVLKNSELKYLAMENWLIEKK
ncbi:MAG: carbamoyltransferase C-terminal domain-containing protein [Candidatus Aenigmatarchaeota archaeon]